MVIPLEGALLKRSIAEKYCFEIHSPQLMAASKKNKEGRLYFKAESEAEFNGWFSDLRSVCGRTEVDRLRRNQPLSFVPMGPRAQLLRHTNLRGETPLHAAASYGLKARTDLDPRVDLDPKRVQPERPVQTLVWLVENGCAVQAADMEGNTAIHLLVAAINHGDGASSSSSAAAAATPTRRGSGHSSYKQGAVSVSAAAEAPQSPPLVQRSTGGVETGGATPLFVQLQQYEDDLMKSVGWNGHSLDAALVTSQEEQNGSSALARTQKVGNARLIHLAFFISVLFSILSILMTTIDSHYIRIQLQMESFLFATIAGSKRPMAVRRHFIATRFHRWPALSGPAPCFRAKSPCRKSPLAGGFACTC